MKELTERLEQQKSRWEDVLAPEEMEARLRAALDRVEPKPARHRIVTRGRVAAAAVLAFSLFAGSQYHALAYYGKKLLGFDDIGSGTLQALNEQGLGQSVEERVTLQDGTELILDGVMSDANQFILYYTLKNPRGLTDESGSLFTPGRITGFWTNASLSTGQYRLTEDKTEIKGIYTFDPVSPFAQKLTLSFWDEGTTDQRQERSVTFPYRPEEAMETTLKQSINRTLKTDGSKLTFRSIQATPTMTLIEGTFQTDRERVLERSMDGVELMVNGKPMEAQGTGVSHTAKGRLFEVKFDALPSDLQSLQIVLKDFLTYEKLNRKLTFAELAQPQTLAGEELRLLETKQGAEGLEVTIETSEEVRFEDVSLGTKEGELVPLEATVNQTIEAKEAGGPFYNKRTLVFKTKGEPDFLQLGGMYYRKAYNETIDIPIR